MNLHTNPFDDDKLHEECGIFGIFGTTDAATHTVLGLHALQHRGQEAAGITPYQRVRLHSHKSNGHVGDNVTNPHNVKELNGTPANGQER